MINSFIDMVRESMEVDEMGINNIKKLSDSSLGKVGTFGQNLRKVRTLLKNVKSTEIIMQRDGGARKYYPRFTNPEIIAAMRDMYNEDSTKFEQTVGNWYDITGGGIHMLTNDPSEFQRSHFPDGGIPETIRGIGLGLKLYRALLRTVGYISSNPSGTNVKDNVWASLVQKKTNPDGTLSEEDAYAIVGKGNWIVFDKSMDRSEIIRIATNFIDEKIRFINTDPNKFDMDDELLSFMPEDILARLNRSYLSSLVTDGRISEEKLNSIISSQAEAEARARERADIAARAERERLAREEANIRATQITRLSRFGVDPDADWDVGDFIVVKQYLYSGWEPLPIREVAEFYNGTYYALSIKDMIRVRNNEISPRNVNDTRTTNDKTKWLKVELDQIPDLENVNFSREELEYIKQKLSPEVIVQRQKATDAEETTRRSAETSQNVSRATDPLTYGYVPVSAADITNALRNRSNVDNINLLKKLRGLEFTSTNSYIVMGPPQLTALRNNYGIPVFIPWTGSERRPRAASLTEIQSGRANLTNGVTGVSISRPYSGLGLQAFELSAVDTEDKIRSRGGQHFYIAGHQNVFGVVAKSEYGAVNTNRQQFIYLRVYGYNNRPVSVRLDLLRKLGPPVSI